MTRLWKGGLGGKRLWKGGLGGKRLWKGGLGGKRLWKGGLGGKRLWKGGLGGTLLSLPVCLCVSVGVVADYLNYHRHQLPIPIHAYCLLSFVVRSFFLCPCVMSRDLTSLPPVFLDLNSVPEFSWIPFVDYSFWKICVLRLVIIGFSSRLHLHH